MASLPVQNYSSKNVPLWIPNDGSINVSTINVSTLTTDVLGVLPNSNSAFVVTTAGSGGIEILAETRVNQPLSHLDYKTNSNSSSIVGYTQGIPANSSNYNYSLASFDLAGNPTVLASMALVSSIGPGSGGGVELKAQDNTSVIIGGESVYSGITSAGDYLLQSFNPPSDAILAHYSDGSLYNSQILFSGGTGGASTITIQSGSGNVEVGIGQAGITMSPGASNSVSLVNGSLDINNLAIKNVSSINTANAYVNSYINPYGGTLQTSTVASVTTAVPFALLSSISSHTYLVQVEFSAVNGGGGAATDQAQMGIRNYDSNLGPLGRFVQMDTWIVDQSYTPDAYRVSRSAIVQATTGALELVVQNGTGGGNVQIVQVESIFAKDLGVPVNNY